MLCKLDHELDLHALIVDDSIVVRKMLDDMIKHLFLNEIDMAKDGAEAVERIAKKEYDLIITDINMPKMNGVDLVKHIREQNKEIPIFVISGESDKEYFIDLINEEICGFIAKPFNETTVVSHLKKICAMISDKKLIAYYQEKLEERNLELDRLNAELARANEVLNLKNSMNAKITNACCVLRDCPQRVQVSTVVKKEEKPSEESYFKSLEQLDLDDLEDLCRGIEYQGFRLYSAFDSHAYGYITDKLSSIALILSRYSYFKDLAKGLYELEEVLKNNKDRAEEKSELLSGLFGSFASTFSTYLDNVWKIEAANANYYDASLLGDMKIFEEILVPSHTAEVEIDLF